MTKVFAKKRLDDLIAVASTNPVVFHVLEEHLAEPLRFTLQDALVAALCALAEQNAELTRTVTDLVAAHPSSPVLHALLCDPGGGPRGAADHTWNVAERKAKKNNRLT